MSGCDVVLKVASAPTWAPQAVAHFDAVLVDHAHCEKKAAAHALSLLSSYPSVPGLARSMARLAREEASHLAQVIAIMEKRGLFLGRDGGDPYAQGLQKLVRTSFQGRLTDQLLVSALIEARSQERLFLLSEALAEPELRTFYGRLALAEAGHGNLFLKLAARATPEDIAPRLEALTTAEAELITRLPVRPAIH
jgi:tRNA-(ms[2]io[6]A)-hydroxylase